MSFCTKLLQYVLLSRYNKYTSKNTFYSIFYYVGMDVLTWNMELLQISIEALYI